MHSLTDLGTNVPAFLAKLWKLVEDPETNDLICWNDNGSSFVIHNQAQFCRELLPLYYKHNNMASFVRQLNMYGFHKKVSVDSGGLKLDRDEMEFAHPNFLRGQPYLLEHIKRKIAEPSRTAFKTPEVINRVLGDVKNMKGRQESLDGKLSTMKLENEALWRELAQLRQKHLKQQQIVNKLIQFLLTVVQNPNNRGLGIKRRFPPLMLDNREHHHHHHHHKHHKRQSHGASSSSTDGHPASAPSSPPPHRIAFSDDEASKADETQNGPTIHELDPNSEYILPDQSEEDELLDSMGLGEMPEVATEVNLEKSQASATVTSPSPSSQVDIEASRSPLPNTLGLDFEPESLLDDASVSLTGQEEAAGTSRSSDVALLSTNGNGDSQSSSVSRWGVHPLGEELDNHLESMQSDLNGLKELLQNENCSLDANTLLSLFAEDPISLGMGLPSQEGKDDDSDTIGSELISYNPTLFDLTDEMEGTTDPPLFAGEEESLLNPELQESSGLESIIQQNAENELTTPHPKLERPEFPEPARKRRK